MRGKPVRQMTMVAPTPPDELVPEDHPIRRIKPVVEEVRALVSAAAKTVRHGPPKTP